MYVVSVSYLYGVIDTIYKHYGLELVSCELISSTVALFIWS